MPFKVIVLVPVPDKLKGVAPPRFSVGDEFPKVNVETLPPPSLVLVTEPFTETVPLVSVKVALFRTVPFLLL